MTRKTPPKLHLPDYPMTLRAAPSGTGRTEVFDPLRQRWVTLTAEERVRQQFNAWLIHAKGFPASRMANELTINLNDLSRRCDTVVFDTSGRHPLAIIEFKAPHIKITAEVLAQAARYNIVLATPILILSNGLTHYCIHTVPGAPPEFLHDIPAYTDLDQYHRQG